MRVILRLGDGFEGTFPGSISGGFDISGFWLGKVLYCMLIKMHGKEVYLYIN